MRGGVFFVKIVRVVGHDERDAHAPAQLDEFVERHDFLVDAVVLQLEVEILFSENVNVFLGKGSAPSSTSPASSARGMAPATQALVAMSPRRILPQHFHVDARLVIEPLEVSDARKLHEVFVALVVAREQDEVVVVFLAGLGLVKPRLRRNIRLEADDRLDAFLKAGVVRTRPRRTGRRGR